MLYLILACAELNFENELAIDNDGDGFVDCDDWDCSYNNLIDVCSVGICEL